MSKLSQHRGWGPFSPGPLLHPSGSKENTTALSADQAPTASGQGQQVDQRKNSKGKPVFAVTALSLGMGPGLASKQRVATTSATGQHLAEAQVGPAVSGNCPRCEILSGRNEDLGEVPRQV